MTPQEIANTPGLGSTGFGFSLPDFKLPVSFDFSAALAAIQKDNPQLAESIKQQQAKQDLAKAQQNLTQQILAQGTASQWSGQGFGSAEANAKNMAEILAGIGITDIRQFGEIKQTVRGDPIYQSRGGDDDAVIVGYGPDKVVTTYGNKVTGQQVPSTYGERQTGNAWGGTFAGKGNTGYRVQFAPDGTPVFYTTAASSNDLANILQDNKLLNFAANAAASYFGGPAGVAALQLAQGKDIEDAAKAAVISYVANEAGTYVRPEVSQTLGGGTAGNVAADALIGGTLAEAQGGDFLKGALQSGISSGINEAKLSAADQYINSVEPGIGYDPATSPTELDVIAAFPELAPAPVFDTSFTPDYSLSTGAPVIPDMGAQGIQVPTITELVDVVGQPVDYSLPIPDSGLGLVMPTAPNLDSMGGGQGLVIPVDGGVITEAGFIPDTYVPDLGDPNSFINQPAPNVEVNIPELPAEQPKDISGELAALDLVKALAPIAVGAALNKDQPQTTTDEKTGYPILPIPADWKAPEYSMAFTPSAALDFGSPDLLQGTQWANQRVTPAQMNYSLSDVMNTLNYQSVPFVQQQMQPFEQSFSVPDILQQFQTKPNVGMNDIIGGLNGRQVSISDIISGIQSQYGQKAAS
jgi:hypothetical protein